MIAVVLAAVGGYLANIVLGTLVLTRVLNTRGFRWLHHLLYIATSALAVVAVVVLLLGGRILPGGLLAPALGGLAAIPFAGSHGRRHPIVGLIPLPFYAAALAALTLTRA
jgi:hypothetical protein